MSLEEQKKNRYSLYGDRAVACHGEGFGCCQSVLASLCEEFGMDRVSALKVAGGMGSGIGHSTETCGVITGAVMLIGLKYGKYIPGDMVRSDTKCYEVAQEYFKRFIGEFGAFKCRDLLGADTNTEEGKKYVADNDLYHIKCNQFIRRSAEIIAEMLKES